MNDTPRSTSTSKLPRLLLFVCASLLLCAPLSGCLAVGYTSGGGWFVWPGVGVLLVLFLLFYLLRGRR